MKKQPPTPIATAPVVAKKASKAVAAPKSGKRETKKPKAGTSKAASAVRRTKFIEAFIANGENGTDAAIVAGFSKKTAYSIASRLLKDVEVQQEIDARRAVLADKFALRTEDVVRELAKIVYADPRKAFGKDGNLLPVSEWPDEVAAMVASVETEELFEGQGPGRKHIGYTKKIKLWDKNSAIDKAMKHLGLFKEDNEQRGGAVTGLPREMMKLIVERLRELKRPGVAGQPTARGSTRTPR
jgi:phage terminase small subunit